MQKLVTLNNPRLAQAFIDYMAAKDITIEMMPEGEGKFALWLLDEKRQVEAEQELASFLDNPDHSKYQAASWDLADTRTRQFHYGAPSMLSMIKAKAGPVTLLLMLASVVIFALLQFGLAQTVFSALHFPAQGGQQWQLWRWISHALLHFSVTHIVFNLLWCWQLGGDIEKKLGSVKLIQLFILSAALSGAGQYWVEGANFGGLSGVVYAMLGYIWVIGEKAPKLGLTIAKPLLAFMLIWLVIGFVQPFMAIANTAHLVGLLSGIALAWVDAVKLNSKAQD